MAPQANDPITQMNEIFNSPETIDFFKQLYSLKAQWSNNLANIQSELLKNKDFMNLCQQINSLSIDYSLFIINIHSQIAKSPELKSLQQALINAQPLLQQIRDIDIVLYNLLTTPPKHTTQKAIRKVNYKKSQTIMIKSKIVAKRITHNWLNTTPTEIESLLSPFYALIGTMDNPTLVLLIIILLKVVYISVKSPQDISDTLHT
ncbi:hypothetical protein [Anaerovibrio sp. JC8]|uniref:hypothetical protein n=1 Tax=Anaerovibrio sp. JC8 TaxID=1240085 RepID=UPI000A10050F|nr:hypothetical protein [Anaerovibrio sp. JC8]